MWTPTSDKTVDEFHPQARIFFSQPLNDELVAKLKDTVESLSQQHTDYPDTILADMKECLAAAEETIRVDEFMRLIDLL
jgi:hypothetical protein